MSCYKIMTGIRKDLELHQPETSKLDRFGKV